MNYAFGVAKPAREWQMPPRRQRRAKAGPRADAEKLERDFWRAVDIDKFSRGWKRKDDGPAG